MGSQKLLRHIRLACVAVSAGLFVVGLSAGSGAQQAGGGGVQQRPQASADAPAEQVYKNIQVLKGMPSDQLQPTMESIAASMGVRCDFCHVPQQFERDDKDHKVIARRMMQMQLDLNNRYLALFENQRISCYTCHQGRSSSPHTLALPVAAPGGGARPASPGPGAQPPAATPGGQTPGAAPAAGQPATPAPRPSAEEVLAKYVAAVGGREAVAKVKSVSLRGTREGARGASAPFEATFAEPDRFVVVTTLPAQGESAPGETRQSYSGAKGWYRNQRGVRELSSAEIAELRAAARHLSAVKIAEPFPKMTLTGRARVGESAAWVLEAKVSPLVTQRFYFDAQTGLLLRQLTLRHFFLQDVPEQIDYEDYRDVDGLKLPFTVRVSGPNANSATVRKLTEVRTNVAVDDALFRMPAATP